MSPFAFSRQFFLFSLETPETAFIYALTSASVMHSVAKACAKGELTECGCDKSTPVSPSSPSLLSSPSAMRARPLFNYPMSSTPSMSISFFPSSPTVQPNEGFEWGGCSDDLKFGRNVSVSFIDQQESFISRRQIVRLVNLHNNEAGRQVGFRKRSCFFLLIRRKKNTSLLFSFLLGC